MIEDFKDILAGQTALIVGNGPSLAHAPLFELMDKYPTFAANKIYDYPNIGMLSKYPEFWACGDGLMLHDCIPWVINHPSFTPEKFVPRDVPLPGSHGMNLRIDLGFSLDAAHEIFMGGTVSYINMQLAKYMGVSRLLLIGMDHRYAKTAVGGKPGSKFIATGEDPDHFGNGYFEPGKIYSRPELEATEKYFYPLAKAQFEDIINLTDNSALTIFRKEKAEKWI